MKIAGIQTVSSTTAPCPVFEYGIVNQDDTALDPDVFIYTQGDDLFIIDTYDEAYVDEHDLKVTVKYAGSIYPIAATLPFQVKITSSVPAHLQGQGPYFATELPD